MSKRDPETGEVSEPQRIANQANGQRAAGQKTLEGSARSAQNSGKHQCYWPPGKLTPEEDPDVFDAFEQEHLARLQPTDVVELNLAKEWIWQWWLMDRADRWDATLQERLELADRQNKDWSDERDFGTALHHALCHDRSIPIPDINWIIYLPTWTLCGIRSWRRFAKKAASLTRR